MMKKIIESENTTKLLLMIISILLGLLVFFGKKQVDTIESLSSSFYDFQLQTIEKNSNFEKSLQHIQTWTEDFYSSEIHPNTIRSQKNEKEIIHIKADVNHLKSKLR